MTTKPPPVPPENRSRKGPGDDRRPPVDGAPGQRQSENLNEQDRFGNIKQNTTHPGIKSDR